jgi:purine-binding chemotaxis protein CheW
VSYPEPTDRERQLVVFSLEGNRYAVELDRVDRVAPMVALAPFPKAPGIVSGVFDFRGRLVPAVNVRRRFRLPERAPRISDQLLLVRTRRHPLALIVDAVEPVVAVQRSEVAAAEDVVPGLEFVRGIVRLPAHGIVFIHDLDTFLSLEEEARLAGALENG